MKNKDLFSVLNTPAFFSLGLPFCIFTFAIRKGFKFIMEDKIKDINKKVLFNYLIENRIFIESLTDEDIKRYYKIFSSLRKNRIKQKIFNFFNKFRKDCKNEK